MLGERIPSQAIKSDFTVDRFSRNIVNSTPDMSEVSAMAREYMISCLDELFGFSEMTRAARALCSTEGWREQKAEEEGKRPSTILKRRSAIIISNTLPASLAELAETEGIGPKTIKAYGQ